MNIIEKIHQYDKFGSQLGLERIGALMERLGNPQDGLKYIHVAGTNGKGSVCRYIYEALRSNGYKVGIYTSPFLQVFNERIEFDGEYIPDDELTKVTETVIKAAENMVQEGMDSPTEFEVITAAAFLYFAKKEADFVVLEVGLGGKGDSTNIIREPLISIITSISYDHTDRLGSTLAEIAGEKAGIIKKGVPVVMNVSEREPAAVIARKAYECGSVLHDVSRQEYHITQQGLTGTKIDTFIDGTDYRDVEISMPGRHQAENLMTALVALEILRKNGQIKVERGRLYEGLKKAKQIGRFEVMAENPYIILDGAHNQAGAATFAEAVKNYFGEDSRLLIVFGVLGDKDVAAITESLWSTGADFAITEPNNPRKLTADELFIHMSEKDDKTGTKRCLAKGTPEEMCEYAMSHRGEYAAVLFVGSLYLIGNIRTILENMQI